MNSALRDADARAAQPHTALGDFLLEQAAAYERMGEAERAEFHALMDTTDHTFVAQLAQIDGVRDAATKPAGLST